MYSLVLSCTHRSKTTVGKIQLFAILRIGYDSILVFYLFSYLFVLDLPVQENPVQVNAFVVKQKNPRKAGNLGRYLAGRVPRRCGANAPKQRRFSRRQGRCAGMVQVGFAYNFLPEGKIYILVRWTFHLREPFYVGICIFQWNQSCAFICAVRVRTLLADLPPKLPPKGFGTGQHRIAPFCTHGTKSVLSLGTQYHQTQQNSTLTHKL